MAYGPVQLRIADCLIPLSALFGWPAIIGVTLGAFISNAYYVSATGVIDVILGPIANFIAASLILYLRKRLFMACVIGAVAVGTIVGGYLWIYFPPPEVPGLSLPAWGAMMVSITISSVISVAGFGYALTKTLRASGFAQSFGSSRGRS